VIYLTLPELLRLADRAITGEVVVRDHRLLEAALARPRTTVGGADAYSALEEKAAALLHSLARNQALIDGNKRLALAATIAFLGMNGRRLTFSNDDVYDFVIAVAVGEMDDVHQIASRISKNTKRR
jgi:death-on-curing protein